MARKNKTFVYLVWGIAGIFLIQKMAKAKGEKAAARLFAPYGGK